MTSGFEGRRVVVSWSLFPAANAATPQRPEPEQLAGSNLEQTTGLERLRNWPDGKEDQN